MEIDPIWYYVGLIIVVVLLTIRGILPKLWKSNPKHIKNDTFIVTGTLVDLGYILKVTFANATYQPTQRVEKFFTDIYFGNGILRIFHEPFKYEFFPDVYNGLKLTVHDLNLVNGSLPLYFGSLTEEDGIPGYTEVQYRNIHSEPTVENHDGYCLITFLVDGITRTITISADQAVDMAPDLKSYITIIELYKS